MSSVGGGIGYIKIIICPHLGVSLHGAIEAAPLVSLLAKSGMSGERVLIEVQERRRNGGYELWRQIQDLTIERPDPRWLDGFWD